jgi:predicted AAA+ superfamily ATPase
LLLQNRTAASILHIGMEFQAQIPRTEVLRQIQDGLAHWPVTAILGPRQSGKTWLARHFQSRSENYFTLDNFVDKARLEDSYFKVLDGLEGVVVIDEIQQKPELFTKLRVLCDRPNLQTRFLITGSASPGIIKGVSESLAGRVRLLPLSGFAALEVGWDNWPKLWLRGGLPPAYLHEIEENSFEWRIHYLSTFIGRDLPLLAETRLSNEQLRRFLQFLAHSHGQHWTHSEAAKTIGVSYHTIQRHIELLKGAYLIRELPPYFANIGKRLRKASKIYFRDSGLLHALLMLRESSHVSAHPRYGASWEGFCIEQIVRLTNSREEECFCFSVQGGEEIDLVIQMSAGLFAFEFKTADAPQRTKSMLTSVEALGISRLFLVYPGQTNYNLHDRIEAVGFVNLPQILSAVA